jgi:sugar phosphate isomerase/epimerase
MQLGIFAKTFVRPSLEEAFDAAKANGLDCVQFNFSCAGLPTLPETIEPGLARLIKSAVECRSLSMPAVSGTCNLIHPDPAQRAEGVRHLQTLIRACPGLGASVVTLCTGTRDPGDMWRAHPDNNSPAAWSDLAASLEVLLPIAQASGAVLGVEPEPANVIDSAPKARRLLDEMQSPALKIVFDAANLVQPRNHSEQTRILTEAFDLLGRDIVLAHAKDFRRDPAATTAITVCAAGQGVVDYGLYVSLLAKAGFNGPLILHGLTEDEVPAAVTFLNQHLRGLHERINRRTDAVLQPRPS